tara:strand:+ start:229 stop:948 length:720 start_codon:yes stop_codon:yes gene_type:complete
MDMNEDEIKTAELKVWAIEHFNQMAMHAIWRPDGTGLRYRKTADNALTLEHRVDHPDSLIHHEKIVKLYESVNIEIEDDSPMVTPAALSAEEAYRMEIQERQAIASAWSCQCGVKLSDLELEEAVPTYLGNREILLDDGNTQEIEDWAFRLACHSCDEIINMNPDDYNLLAGDELFMRYKTSDNQWVYAMTRQEMLKYADSGRKGILVGSKCPLTQGKVPPWVWGTYCKVDMISEGEEE